MIWSKLSKYIITFTNNRHKRNICAIIHTLLRVWEVSCIQDFKILLWLRGLTITITIIWQCNGNVGKWIILQWGRFSKGMCCCQYCYLVYLSSDKYAMRRKFWVNKLLWLRYLHNNRDPDPDFCIVKHLACEESKVV